MTQEELGKAIGFHSQTAIQFIECGKTRLRVVELLKIASVLRVSSHVLLGSVEYGKKKESEVAPRKIVSYEATPFSQSQFFIPRVAPSGA